MSSLVVVDQLLCCSGGLCGTGPDPALLRFAADVAWLEGNGVAIERINPAEDPKRCLGHPAVAAELEARGDACLPIVLCDGGIVSTGHYPDRDELEDVVAVCDGRGSSAGHRRDATQDR